jgi:NAD(P)-dependent dehydrogenase (short-subunit alcohol dehydrogenase family)
MSVEKGPVVWVTGASRGIGAAVARAFAADGARVALSGRTVVALRRNTREIEQAGWTAVSVECDVTSEASVRRAFDLILKKFGRIDVLVNNAGVTYFKPFEQTTVKEFDHVIATNLRGTFLCAKSVLPAMVKRGHGYIINIISVTATTAFENSSAYAAAKAGMLGMSRSLRAEVRKKGVRVIDILPGAVETEMWSSEARKKYHEKMMQPKDVADVVVSLFRQPQRIVTEEILIRPLEGDL